MPKTHSAPPHGGSKRRLRSYLTLEAEKRSRNSQRRLRFEPLEDRRLLAIDITEYPTLSAHATPTAIITGPDGNLWFTESGKNALGSLTPGGEIQPEYTIPTDNSFPGGIATGADHNLWFTEGKGKIGRFNPSAAAGSQFTEFNIPHGGAATSITAGPDGNLWYVNQTNNSIGRVTTAGDINEYDIRPPVPSTIPPFIPTPLPPYTLVPYAIAAGPDGNLWFTELNGNKIGRITTAGVVTEFNLPDFSAPEGIAAGPDGSVWFTEQNRNTIGRITPAGVITEYPIFTGIVQPTSITAGADGNLYFSEAAVNRIGYISPTTDPANPTIPEITIPSANSAPSAITAGPDGNVWFAEYSGSRIGRVNVPPSHDQPADLYIKSLVASADPVKPGDPITYTITIRNGGSHTAHNVVVYDPIPALTSFNAANGDTITSNQGSASVGTGLVNIGASQQTTGAEAVVKVGDLDSGLSVIVTLKVHAVAGGDIANKVIVTADTPESFPADNTSTLHTTCQPLATNFQLLSSVDSPLKWTAKTDIGTEGKFNWTLSRTGGDAPQNVVVSMLIPKTLTNIRAYPPNVFNGIPNADGTTSLSFAWPTLASGQTINFGFFGTPTDKNGASPLGNISVTANVTDSGQINGSNSPLSKTNTTNVQATAATLSLTGVMAGDASGNPLTIGGDTSNGNFLWVLRNKSGDKATGVTAQIYVPRDELTYDHAFTTGSYKYDDFLHVLTFTLPDLNVGATTIFGFVASPLKSGIVSAEADVYADQKISDYSKRTDGNPLYTVVDTNVEQISVSLSVGGDLIQLDGPATASAASAALTTSVAGITATASGSDLSIANRPVMTIAADSGAVTNGGVFIWKLTYNGGAPMENFTATVQIPPTLQYVSAAVNGISNAGPDDKGLLTFKIPNLTTRGSSVSFSLDVNPKVIGPVSVTARVTPPAGTKIDGGGSSMEATIDTYVFSSRGFHLYNPNPNNILHPPPGPVIPHIDLRPIYYGQQWAESSDPNVTNFPGQMQNAMQDLVTSPFMNLLNQYSVKSRNEIIGNGSVEPLAIVNGKAAPGVSTDDAPSVINDGSFGPFLQQIKGIVAKQLDGFNGKLPDSENTVFVVYTPPGTLIRNDFGNPFDQEDSKNDFRAYHGVVRYFHDFIFYTDFKYIVMPWLDNATNGGDSRIKDIFDNETEVFSHELAETITDPELDNGWRDYKNGNIPNEIGDLAWSGQYYNIEGDGDFGYMSFPNKDKFAVQYEWSNDYVYPGTNIEVFDQPVLPQLDSGIFVNLVANPHDKTIKGVSVQAAGYSFSGLISTFSDFTNATNDPSSYTVTIDWGDGSSSGGTVTYDANLKQYLISATHTFVDALAGDTAMISILITNNATGVSTATEREVTLQQSLTDAANVQFDQQTFDAYRNGSDATIIVDRVGDTTLGATVDYHVSGGTAVDGTDYQAEKGTLTFAPGATTATILLPVYSNPAATSDLTVNLTLSTPIGNVVLGNQATTVVTIHTSDQVFTPPAPALDANSDVGASGDDGITAKNGSATAPLTFTVTNASVRNGYLQLVDVTDPDNPILLGEAVQANNGAATITLNDDELEDGTHEIAVINSTGLTAGARRASQATEITIDSVTPTSKLTVVPAFTKLTSLPVNWSGHDNTNGSGLQGYNISVSVDGAAAVPWLSNTTDTSASFSATLGHSYSFFSSAVDVAGNSEPTHAIADASVVVTDHPWHNSHAGRDRDVTDDGHVVADDVVTIINYINAKGSGLLPVSNPNGSSPRFVDTDGDNQVTATDVVFVINFINAHPGLAEAEADATESVAVADPLPTSPISQSTTSDDLLFLLASDIASQATPRRART